MGSRANLVIVNEEGYELYYCHWCARSLKTGLFWGLETALAYIKGQERVDQMEGGGWLEVGWADGGVVLDARHKALLLYGGESLSTEIPLRRLFLELLQIVWTGWTVNWAYDGVLNIVDYVGVPRQQVEAPPSMWIVPLTKWIRAFIRMKPPYAIIASMKLRNGAIRLHPMSGDMRIWLARPGMLCLAMQFSTGVSNWQQPVESRVLGGFHIDMNARKLSVWGTIQEGVAEQMKPLWSGWQIEWLRDNFEAHIALTENRLSLEQPSPDELLAKLEKILLDDYKSPVDFVARDIAKTLADLSAQGATDIVVNLGLLRDHLPQIDKDARKRIFDSAVAAWKAKQPPTAKP